MWDRAEDIDFDKPPDQFVLKANHSCHANIVVTDKATIDVKKVRKKLNHWLEINAEFMNAFEMQYKDILRKIIAERYTKGKNRQETTKVAVYVLLPADTADTGDSGYLTERLQTGSGQFSARVYCDDDFRLSVSRVNYDRLISDCKVGRIDRVICRSVADFVPDLSEFVDVLHFLKKCGVTAFFEKEGLDTTDPSAEKILSGLEAFCGKKKRDKSEVHRQTVQRKKLSPPPFSGKIICGNCGRFFHITNRRTRPIWVCPSARLNNGLEICTMEHVYEKDLIEILKLALVHRFAADCRFAIDCDHLVLRTEASDSRKYMYRPADCDHCISALTEQSEESAYRSSACRHSLPVLSALAERLEQYDGLERRERQEIERQVRKLSREKEDRENAVRGVRSRLDVQRVRAEVLGEEDPDEESISSLEAKLTRAEREVEDVTAKEMDVQNQMRQREVRWEELRKGEADRRKLREWMGTLSSSKDFWK